MGLHPVAVAPERGEVADASLVGDTVFDDSDWQATDIALPTTDVEQSAWYDYPLSGRAPLTLLIAADPGSSVVFVRFGGVSDDHTKAQIEAALHIFASWELV